MPSALNPPVRKKTELYRNTNDMDYGMNWLSGIDRRTDRVDLCHEFLTLSLSRLLLWRFPVACRVQHRQKFHDDFAESTRRLSTSRKFVFSLSFQFLVLEIRYSVQWTSQSINQNRYKSWVNQRRFVTITMWAFLEVLSLASFYFNKYHRKTLAICCHHPKQKLASDTVQIMLVI